MPYFGILCAAACDAQRKRACVELSMMHDGKDFVRVSQLLKKEIYNKGEQDGRYRIKNHRFNKKIQQ